MKLVSIIPARGGSKRLPGKNIANVAGKPLISYTIEAALESGIFERIIVTTDSPEIAKVAISYSGVVLIEREPKLALDSTPTFPVVEDVLRRITCERFCLLQPTSPLRRANHICDAYNTWNRKLDRFDFCVSVERAHTPRGLIHELDQDSGMSLWTGDYSKYRSQDYLDYQPNGAIYFAKTSAYLTQKHFYGARTLAYEMDAQSSIDIDNEIDAALASLYLHRSE